MSTKLTQKAMREIFRKAGRRFERFEKEDFRCGVKDWADKIMRLILEAGCCAVSFLIAGPDAELSPDSDYTYGDLIRALKRDLPYLRFSVKEDRGNFRLIAKPKIASPV